MLSLASIPFLTSQLALPASTSISPSPSELASPTRLSVLELRSGWRSIWDGKTLDHWRIECAPDLAPSGKSAEVLDGWLVAPEASGLSLRFDTPVSDADLLCDYRSWIEPALHCANLRVTIEGQLRQHHRTYHPNYLENQTFEITPWTLRPSAARDLWDLAVEPSFQRHALRNIRLRDLHHLPGTDVPLFDGHSLDAFHPIGDASFTVDDESILAQSTSGASNAFLVSNNSFGDFLLDLDLTNELPGNSGIQLRSRVVGPDPAHSYATGYQIEIDPSPRAWSGGLYEERGRGWLQDLSHNDAGRRAFRLQHWNHYRIECIGPWIRAWVNDIPTTDTFDPDALEGILALQVHSGHDTKLRFSDLHLHTFGRHEWKPLEPAPLFSHGAPLGNDFSLRLTRNANASLASLAGMRLHFRANNTNTRPELAETHELLVATADSYTLALDDPRLLRPSDHQTWKQLSLLVYANRLTLHLDRELFLALDTLHGADGPIVWLERPSNSNEPAPLASFESIDQVP